MTTSPDSVTYRQTVSEVVGASEGADWSSTYRPVNPWTGLFGYATDLDTYEFRIAADWRHPAWTEGAAFTGPVSFFRFGYGATVPLVKMQSAGTDAAGAAQQVLSISQQVTHTGAGGAGAVGALYSASTIDGAPNQDYYAAAFTTTNRAKRDSSATPDQAQHGTLFTHQVKDLPSGGLGPGEVMSDSWVQWWVMQDRTNLPSSQGGALVGVEFDISGNNADDAPTKKRFVRQAVLNNYAGDAAHPLEWGYGDYWNSFTGGTADTFFNVVSAYYAGWTVAAIDLSQGTGARANPYIDGTNRGVAIKMRDGAKLGFNGDGATGSYMTHGSSRYQFWSGGSEVASVSDAGVGIFGGGAAPITLSSGIISVPASQSLSVRLQTAGQTITFGAPSAGLGNALTITPQSGGNTAQSANPNLVAAGNMLQSPFYQTPNSGYSITGDVNWVPPLNLRGTITGTNTAVGSTGPAFIKMSGTYSGTMSSGIFNMLGIYENASGFDGALTGVKVQLATTGTSSLTSSTFGLISTEFVAIANHNMGGVSTGFGVTQFGVGVLFGANPRALNKAGTYLAGTVGQESAAAIYSGAQSGYFAVHQFVLEDLHATHGITRDCMAVFGAQGAIVAGVREVIEIGGPAVHWPGDANGYLFAGHFTATAGTTIPVVSAGGIDVNDVAFTGSGTWGGGFILRGEGAYIIPSSGNGGAFRAGHMSLASNSTGGQISIDQDKMTGTPVINAAGTNWSANHIAGDVYGNVVQITTVSAGTVTGISVLRRGWVPTGTGGTTGVAFTCKNVVGGTLGQGLTLNLTWTPQTDLTIQPTAGQTIYMPALQASTSYANDAAAAIGGVAVGQLYRNGSVIQLRIV